MRAPLVFALGVLVGCLFPIVHLHISYRTNELAYQQGKLAGERESLDLIKGFRLCLETTDADTCAARGFKNLRDLGRSI